MAKYFLGSVGTAEAFRIVDGKPVLAFVSKTLTDSGINISTTKDDIRAGEGAPIVTSFYHDPSVEITLTDVMFKTEYVEAQLGVDFETGSVAYKTANATITSTAGGILTTPEDVQALPLGCNAGDAAVVWYAPEGSDEWAVYQGQTLPQGNYCLRYLGTSTEAKIAEVYSTMIPQELFLIITAPIYAGDACSASNGKKAGTIQFEVPRFRLAGAQDFAMSMSSNQTMSLSGNAMASEGGCEENGSKLLRIIEVIYNRNWADDIAELFTDSNGGEVPEIYGIKNNGAAFIIDNSEFTFAPALVDGKAAATGNTTATLKAKTSLTAEIKGRQE